MVTSISPELLSSIPLFADLTKTESEELMKSFEEVAFAAGDVVYAATEKLPNGTLVTDKIFLFIPASNDTKQ